VYNNPWADILAARDDWRMSQQFINLLNTLADPREPIYAQPTAADPTTYRGSPNGLLPNKVPPGTTTSRPGAIFYKGPTTYGPKFGGTGQALPTYLLTAAEVNLILAEASERSLGGLTPATAATYYNAGITASMQQWSGSVGAPVTISATQIANYEASAGVAYTGGVAGLKQIAQQKYIALFTDGPTTWAEWRRTCIPNTIVPGPDATLTYVPRRFEYPTTEATSNGTSLSAAIAAQGADNLGTRVWWDKAGAPTCA
jgi:hypothetical protein